MNNLETVSTTSTFKRMVPSFPAPNIANGVRFYEQLGFTCRYQDEVTGILVRDEVELHLWQCADRHIAENTGCRIHVTGIRAIHDQCSQLGIVHPNGPLSAKPWGTTEFAILDEAGNIITFFE